MPDSRSGPDRGPSGHGKLAVHRGPPGGKEQATEDSAVERLAGEDFLGILNQAPSTSGTLLDGVVGRLARTHPSHRVAMTEGAADAGPA